MDLVSFETKEEYDWVKGFINGNLNLLKPIGSLLTSHFQWMCLISGLPGVCATLTVVTDLTSSPRTSTAGSGQPTRPGWRPQTAGPPSTTGQPPEGEKILRQKKYVRKYLSLCANISDSVPAPSPSPTTGSRPSWAESPSRVWRCSTTFTATVRLWWSGDIFWWIVFQESSGTMWPVTMRSPSSARMSRVILPSPGRPSPTSGSLEWREHQAILIYLFLYLFTLCHRKVTRKKTGVLPENDHSDASLTFMCIL